MVENVGDRNTTRLLRVLSTALPIWTKARLTERILGLHGLVILDINVRAGARGLVQQSFLDSGTSEPLVLLLLVENQMRLHPDLQTFLIATLRTGLPDVRTDLTAVGKFAPQGSLPVLGSPEKSPTGVAGYGSVVLPHFNILNEAD